MAQPNASGLVGLIVIDSSGDAPQAQAQDGAGDDATLDQLLRRLARAHGGGRWLRPTARFAGASRRQGIATVAADCGRLTAQLEQAARMLRRTVVVAGRIGR
jgi:hypothetical protein